MQPPVRNQWQLAAVTGLLSLIAVTPLCGFLFQCGCDWPWWGWDAGCNYYEAHAEHRCPWCVSMVTGVISAALAILVGLFAALFIPISRKMSAAEIGLRTSLGMSFFVIAALLAAMVAAAWQGYPFGAGFA